MMKNLTFLAAGTGIAVSALAGAVEPAAPSPDPLQMFENSIRPLLVENCYECHSVEAEKLKGGLLLDSKAGWESGGDSGPVLLPGDADNSLLARMIRHEPGVEAMPPKSKLKPDQIEAVIRWIDEGAHDPRDQPLAARTDADTFDLEERKQWWSFQPLQPVPPPPVKQTDWPQTPYDAFILAKLENKGWTPADRAPRELLLRRLSFDLIGLAPTREEVEDFVNDTSPDAYARQVDRLLASPHFGEKWARHWMDIVRYGETKAFEFDYTMPYAHRYRDYLIRAFNADVPYDQFVRESFAGDLLDPPRYSDNGRRNESLQGPGFLFLTVGQHGPPDLHDDEARVYRDVIDTASKAYLGVTVACARCHDHKFDAITTGDYYSWYGMFRSARLDVANSVSRESLAVSEGTFVDMEPDLRNAALEDAGRDVNRIADYIQTLHALETDEPFRAALALHAEASSQGKPPQIKSEATFAEALDPLVKESAEASSLDASVLAAWVHFAAMPGRHRQWPQLKPLFRYLKRGATDESPEPGKRQAPLNTPYPTDLRTWQVSGSAFRIRPEDNRIHFKYSIQGDEQTIQTILDGSNPAAGIYAGKITGAIRSPDFVLDGSPVELYARGKQATVRLIVRSYELAGRGPTTQILSVPIDHAHWKKISIQTKLWQGEPAYLEVVQGGTATRALAPHEVITPVSNDAFVSIHTGEGPDWLGVWEGAEPAEVMHGLWQKAQAGNLRGAEIDVLAALFEAGLVRAGADRSPDLKEKVAAYRGLIADIPDPYFVRSLTEGTPQEVPVYIRGSHTNPSKEPNPRRFMDALGGQPLTADGSGRLEFAEYLVAEDNPLVSRVIVNRIWHYLFGRGIVASVDDFGKLGAPPSHPELLDTLARDFMDQGWSIKTLVRDLLLSSTYQMASTPSPAARDMDPDNVYLQRMPVKRLEAEQIRDHILACSGSLNTKMFGPSIDAYVEDLPAARGKPKSGPLDGSGRRSVYLEIRRSFLDSFLSVFGMPNATEATGRRNLTNVPSQALALMNSPFVHGQAKAWAQDLLKTEQDADSRIRKIHYAAFGRAPTETEIEWAYTVLREVSALMELSPEDGLQHIDPWQELCHIVMNRKEFIYLF